MKILFTLSLLFTMNVFAVEVCTFEDVYDFEQTLEEKNIRPYKIADNHKKLTASEKKLIHTTVSLEDWRGPLTTDEAIEAFFDFWEGEVGSLAGSIRYYKINGKSITLVSYYPGDNEYGAIFGENNKLIARIGDSEIVCE